MPNEGITLTNEEAAELLADTKSSTKTALQKKLEAALERGKLYDTFTIKVNELKEIHRKLSSAPNDYIDFYERIQEVDSDWESSWEESSC